MGQVPAEWMPNAKVARIICHWTAGSYKASSLDRKHYHILIEDDGELIRGYHSIDDNDRTGDGVYAAHTLGMNTGSVGIAVCCMAGAEENPFDAGRFPMTEVQWERMAEVAAELCARYGIPVSERTVLGHGEVERKLGVTQKGKWDPLVLPWKPNLSKDKVGGLFRLRVVSALERLNDGADRPEHSLASEGTSAVPVLLLMNGVALAGSVLFNEGAFVKISSLLDAMGWRLTGATHRAVSFEDDRGQPVVFAHTLLGDAELSAGLDDAARVSALIASGYVSALDLAKARMLPVTWDPSSDRITIGTSTVPGALPPMPAASRSAIKVKPGDTLFKIAERHLGNGTRWRRLLKANGMPFTEEDARALAVGEEIFLPTAPNSQAILVPQSAVPFEADRPLMEALVEAAPSVLRKHAARSIPAIVAECLAHGVGDPAQISYILATSEHESNCGMYMHELGKRAYFDKYEFRKSLGNTVKGDGFTYRGRGFVQLTGRRNYTRWSKELGMDLVGDPELVASDNVAAKILVRGMMAGAFTGKSLPEFVKGAKRDFFNARAVVNGDKVKNGQRIADHALRYLAACSSSTARASLERLSATMPAAQRPIETALPRSDR